MASEPERTSVDDDTIVADPSEFPQADEVTQAGDEWPVTELYYVEPDGEAPSRPDDSGTDETVILSRAESPKRRFPPAVGPGVLFAILGTVAVLIVGAVLLSLDDDDRTATAQTPTERAPAAQPVETPPSQAAAGIAVVDVEGMTVADARAELAKQGLRIRLSRSPSERPRGEILSQSPRAGSEVARRTVVVLVVSAGAKTSEASARVDVPDVVGLSASSAASAIREAGLRPRIRLVPSTEPAGTVVAQSPREGADVAEDTTVRLEVARAQPAVERIGAPDVVGLSAAAARRELQAVGLRVSTVTVVSQEPAGTVIRQSPGAGAELREGATVKLTVSAGPAKVEIPDVTGLDEASARLELEQAGFRVHVVDESTTDPDQDGIVLRQTPLGGSSASEGATVTITVARVD